MVDDSIVACLPFNRVLLMRRYGAGILVNVSKAIELSLGGEAVWGVKLFGGAGSLVPSSQGSMVRR